MLRQLPISTSVAYSLLILTTIFLFFKIRKVTRPKGIEDDASTRPPNIFSVLCDLEL